MKTILPFLLFRSAKEFSMTAKTAIASFGLTVLFALSPALAQDSIAGMTIPEDERESVANHCETLAAADRAAMAEPVGEAGQGQGDHEENPTGEGGEDNAAGQGNAEAITDLTAADDASPAQTSGTMDLSAIDLADCKDAGFTAAE